MNTHILVVAVIVLSVILSVCAYPHGFSDYCGEASKITNLDVTTALQKAYVWEFKTDTKAIISQTIIPKSKLTKQLENVIQINTEWSYRKVEEIGENGEVSSISPPTVSVSSTITNGKFEFSVKGNPPIIGGIHPFSGCEPHYRISIKFPETLIDQVKDKDISIQIGDIGGIQSRVFNTVFLDSCVVNGTTCPSCCSGNGYCSGTGCTCKITHTGPACDKALDISQIPKAKAFGLWQPIQPYDTCPKKLHEQYSIIGPDGKLYNTWHPHVHEFADGSNCTFGHEHGQNPMLARLWPSAVDQYSASQDYINNAGLPFGYVNEQMDESQMKMTRHEDHVGHKVLWEHKVKIDWSPNNNFRLRHWTGAYCDVLTKFHQGTHSPDAIQNNLHEIIHIGRCEHTKVRNVETEVRIAVMGVFGAPGVFHNGACPGVSTVANKVGTQNTDPNYPKNDGMRRIGVLECVKRDWLVDRNKFSGNFYEFWKSDVDTYFPKVGTSKYDYPRVAVQLPLFFAVFNPGRFYDPTRPDKKNSTYVSEVCLMKEVRNGKTYETRGGQCESVKDYYRKNPNVKYDPFNPNSGFTGNQREVYLKAGRIYNPYSTPYFYSNIFGDNLTARPQHDKAKKGKLVQYVSMTGGREIHYGMAYKDPVTGENHPFNELEPTALGKFTDNGDEGVHLPN